MYYIVIVDITPCVRCDVAFAQTRASSRFGEIAHPQHQDTSHTDQHMLRMLVGSRTARQIIHLTPLSKLEPLQESMVAGGCHRGANSHELESQTLSLRFQLLCEVLPVHDDEFTNFTSAILTAYLGTTFAILCNKERRQTPIRVSRKFSSLLIFA